MPSPAQDIELLQASVDEDDDSYLRILVGGRHIRYLTIAPQIYEVDDMCFGPTLASILPPLPVGEWNKAHIAKSPETGKPYFESAIQTELPGIQSTWHPKSFDYLRDLSLGNKLRTNVFEATTPGLPDIVVAKFARFDFEIPYLDQECAAYKWIEGMDIGPKFLGSITEDGRVIGFAIERLTGAHHASPADYVACQEVLGKLHRLGIVHGDINKHNFLVVGNRATLIDFDCADKTTDNQALDGEMKRLEMQLADPSGRGGILKAT